MNTLARNKKALHDYEVLERFEAGLVLCGTEVKSIRAGRINLTDSYARHENGQIVVHHLHIGPYDQGSYGVHEPYRKRTLLLHKREILRLGSETDRKNLTIVPLAVYFKKQWVKMELGLCRGRKKYDKRHDIDKRESAKRLNALVRGVRR